MPRKVEVLSNGVLGSGDWVVIKIDDEVVYGGRIHLDLPIALDIFKLLNGDEEVIRVDLTDEEMEKYC